MFTTFMLGFVVFLVLFDYFKTREMVRGKNAMPQLAEMQKEIDHLKERLEHLEAIASEEDFDAWQESRNKTEHSNDSASRRKTSL